MSILNVIREIIVAELLVCVALYFAINEGVLFSFDVTSSGHVFICNKGSEKYSSKCFMSVNIFKIVTV